MRKNKNIKINKQGEICYKGKLLERSNVYELINHAIHTHKNPPMHMRSFYKILAKSIIPNKLIRNKEGKNIMTKEMHDGDCCDMSQYDTIGKIELIPAFVLSTDKTNG